MEAAGVGAASGVLEGVGAASGMLEGVGLGVAAEGAAAAARAPLRQC